MTKILVLAHSEKDGSLSRSALEVLGQARELSEELYVGLIGETVQSAADQIAGCGAIKVVGVSGPAFGQARYCSDAAAAEAIGKAVDANLVIVPATSRWNRVLAGVAHRLGGRADMHVTKIAKEQDILAVSRWYYRQRMEASLKRSHHPWCIALEPGCHEPWIGEPGVATVENLIVTLDEKSQRTKVTGIKTPSADLETIRPEADLLFVAGAGWTKKQGDGQVRVEEAARIILNFLEQSKASLGGSKSVVDLGGEGQAVLPFMTHLNQIGQTGATPRHPKGLSTCCHGEEPHVVGWRFINERRAINTDPNCSWAAGKCDVLYVADAFKVIAQVCELLAKKRLTPVG